MLDMLDMMKKAWRSLVDGTEKNWQKLRLASILTDALATFVVVFPPAMFPTLVTLATLVAGSALYFVGKAILSFFSAETAPAANATVTAGAEKSDVKGSTAKVSNELEANKVTVADVKADPNAVVVNAAAPAQPAANTASNDDVDPEHVAAFSM